LTEGETTVGTIRIKGTKGRLAAAGLVALLIASGCGSRQSGPGSTSSAAPPSTPAAAPPTDGGASSPDAGPSAVTPGQSATNTAGGAAPTGATGAAATTGTAGGTAAAAKPMSAAPRPSAAAATSAAPSRTGAGNASSAGGSSSPAPGAPTPAAPGGQAAGPTAAGVDCSPKKDAVAVGSLGQESGVMGAVMAASVDGVRAWAASVGERGGLCGHPVRLVLADDGGDPARALSITQKMVEQDHVVAILGNHMITTEQAITSYLEQKQVPLVGTPCSNSAEAASPMVFPIGCAADIGNAWAHMMPLITSIPAENRTSAGLMYCREAPACKPIGEQIKKLADVAGFKLVWESQSSIAQPDYTSEMLSARNAGVKAMIAIMDNNSVVRMMRSAHRQGYDPYLSVQFSVYEDRVARDGGKDVEEKVRISSLTPAWNSSPKMADYRAAMDKYVPGGTRGSWGAMNFVAGKYLEKIGREQFRATPTSADILRGLYSLKGETLGGLTPPLTYLEGKPHADVNLCWVQMKIANGQFVPVEGNPDKFSCAPGWKPAGS
jgi:branched-chain amino acid transport system substrate-binding protein